MTVKIDLNQSINLIVRTYLYTAFKLMYETTVRIPLPVDMKIFTTVLVKHYDFRRGEIRFLC
jgi:hypothetical protein